MAKTAGPEIPPIEPESSALACGVLAGGQRLSIQLLRDIESPMKEHDIVFMCRPAPRVIQPAGLAIVSSSIVAGPP
jgi:hypothetical protein